MSHAARIKREDFIIDRDRFMNATREHYIDRDGNERKINSVTRDSNPYLWPYYRQIEQYTNIYTLGIFIIDTKGVYVPIEEGHCGVVHVTRLPLQEFVFGLTDLYEAAYMMKEESIFIFQGVIATANTGWKFRDESFQIKPIAGISVQGYKLYVRTIEGEVKLEQKKEEESEDDWQ